MDASSCAPTPLVCSAVEPYVEYVPSTVLLSSYLGMIAKPGRDVPLRATYSPTNTHRCITDPSACSCQ